MAVQPLPLVRRVCVAACVVTGFARAQCPDWSDEFALAGPNYRVEALFGFDDGSGPAIYVGGNFEAAGTVVANDLARWNGTSWSTLGSGTGVNSTVDAFASFDDGGGSALYAAGWFSSMGGVAANGIAKWDGVAWSALGQGLGGMSYGSVSQMLAFDDGGGPALFVGGYFEFAGGQPAWGIAKWTGASWLTLGGGMALPSGAPADVDALAIYDDGSGPALYAGGNFASAAGMAAANIARWDGVSWSALGAGPGGNVHSLAVLDDAGTRELWAAGGFGVAKWNGATWTSMPSFGGAGELAVFDDGSGEALYGVTTIQAAGGIPVVRWNGAQWTDVGGPLRYSLPFFPYNPWAHALAVVDLGAGAELAVGGFFDLAGNAPVSNVALWNGNDWHALHATRGTNHTVAAFALSDTSFEPEPALYAGGSFTTAGDKKVLCVARWDGAGWSRLGNGLDSKVHALAFHDDGGGRALYAGGDFNYSPGVPGALAHIARWNGASWSQLGSGLNSSAFALATWDDGTGPALFAGGNFTTAGGVSANRIARWNGATWSPLGTGVAVAGVNPSVDALAVFDDGSGEALYAAGAFQLAGGVSADRIARWDGASWSAVGASGLDSRACALAVFDDGSGAALYVGGQFTHADGVLARHIARWDGASWSNVGAGFDDRVCALAVHDDGTGAQLYAAGDFAASGSTPLEHVAKWTGASWIAVDMGVISPVRALAVFDEPGAGWPALYAGGEVVLPYDGPFQCLARYADECIGQGASYCTAGTTTNGCAASMSSSGIASASASSGFVVTTTDVEGAKSGTLFFGIDGATAVPWGNGTSLRCVTAPLVRTGVQSGIGLPGTCDGVYTQDFNAWMQAHRLTAPGAGATVWMQAWFRDPGNGSNQDTSLSDGLTFVVTP